MGKILVANGCSFTAGDELADADFFPEFADPDLWKKVCQKRKQQAWDDRSIDRLWPMQKARAWPRHLGDLLGVERVDNIAFGGTSVTRMVRTTIPYVLRLLDDGVPPNDIVVVLQWTEAARIERWDDSGSGYYCLLLNFIENYRAPKKDYLKLYIRHFQNDLYDTKAAVQSALLLQSFLRERGVEFLFFEAIGCITEPTVFEPMLAEDSDLRTLWSAMDTTRWLDRPMMSLLTKDPAEIMPFGHFSESIHIQLAQLLRDKFMSLVDR